MARFKDHQKALDLRKQGNSYSQIKKILGVSKSTLSGWLKEYPLSKQRIRELRDWNEQRIERFRGTMRRKKETRLNIFYHEQKKIILPLSNREIFIAGLFLYWGEGGKSLATQLTISNTNPALIKFFIRWLTKNLSVPKNKLRIKLHLYSDMNINKEVEFWSQNLSIPKNQFKKSYIKKSRLADINHKGGFGHGTCDLSIGNARLTEKILMSIKLISDYSGRLRA